MGREVYVLPPEGKEQGMFEIFLCYLHKPHALTPELRVVASHSVNDLPDMIAAELPAWGVFEMVDVYDDNDHRLFSFTKSPKWAS